MDVIKAKPYDLRKMVANPTILLSAKRGQGKSVCIKSLLYHFHKHEHYKVGVICSGSEKYDPFFGDCFPDSFIYDNTDKVFEKVWNRQLKIKEENKQREQQGRPLLDANILLVLDDCIHDVSAWKKDETLRNIIFNGRHFGITLIIATQYIKALGPDIRNNIDHYFVFNTNNIEEIKKLFDTCGGMFGSLNNFKTVLNACTQNYNILVINNRGLKSDISENFGVFKSKLDLKFMFGCDNFIDYHKKHFDVDWSKKQMMLKENGMTGAGKKQISVVFQK